MATRWKHEDRIKGFGKLRVEVDPEREFTHEEMETRLMEYFELPPWNLRRIDGPGRPRKTEAERLEDEARFICDLFFHGLTLIRGAKPEPLTQENLAGLFGESFQNLQDKLYAHWLVWDEVKAGIEHAAASVPEWGEAAAGEGFIWNMSCERVKRGAPEIECGPVYVSTGDFEYDRRRNKASRT